MTREPWHPLDRRRTEPAPPTEAQRARRRRYAAILCGNAHNLTSWLLADRMARLWECDGCAALGYEAPTDDN